jgi:signal transduction histidine kinase
LRLCYIMPGMRGRGWLTYAVVGAVLTVAYYLVPPVPAKLVVWPAIGLSSAAAIVAGTRRNRPSRPLAWYLLAGGQVLFVTGDTLYNTQVQLLHRNPGFPGLADAFNLAFYPCITAGLLLLIRARGPGRDTASLIDATIVTTGLALLAWVFLIGPQVHDSSLTVWQRMLSIAYPLGDVLLLAVAARLAVGPGRRPPAWWLLTGSVVPLLAADVAYGLLRLAGRWQVDGPSDLGRIAFYLGLGAAALHPSMASLSEPAPPGARLPRGRLPLLAGASLIAPAALAVQAARGQPLEVPVIVGGSALLCLLALARMSGLAGELSLQQERKRVTQSVLRMTEAERSRLAADLHDGPVQQLTALLYGLELARHHIRHGDPGAAESLIASLEEKAAAEIHGLRRLMTHLRPPVLDELGLASAIENQGKSFEASSGVPTRFDAHVGGELPPELETVLYRVTQESLTNVGKHARASRVSISLAASNERVSLRIRDDGVGFDPSGAAALPDQDHFGLVSMRERVEMVGGRLVVDSSPGRGTTVAVEMDQRAARG